MTLSSWRLAPGGEWLLAGLDGLPVEGGVSLGKTPFTVPADKGGMVGQRSGNAGSLRIIRRSMKRVLGLGTHNSELLIA